VGERTLRPPALTRVVRVVLLALVAVLMLLGAGSAAPLAWWALLCAAALPALAAPDRPLVVRLTAAVEVVTVALAGVYAGGAPGASLPYLVAPAFAVGLFLGAVDAGGVLLLAVVALSAAGARAGVLDEATFRVPAVEWVVLAGVAAAIGVWVRRLMQARTTEPDYAQVTRLLTQLRTIARQLPGTLDAGSIADRLLDELRQVVPVDRGAVFTGSGGGRLEVLAQCGPGRAVWETSLDADTPVAEAWVSQQPQVVSHSLGRRRAGVEAGSSESGNVSALVLPLVTGVRTVGLVVLETTGVGAYTSVADAAADVARHAALRLETALAFDEVRSLATAEERQRLAREIHDGVAQELVMVGYGIDNAIADLREGGDRISGAEASLRALRAEVTRVITELRLSLFELRSDVDRHEGLGSAIAEYVRTVGPSAALRVHLSLEETTARLPTAVETELLRIAQEAVTNARKHAGAANLWVHCEVDPPYARLEVSDDGRGIADGRGTADGDTGGRYGMSIMAERAERVRGTLEIRSRKPRGTTVSVVLGSRVWHGSVSPQQEVGTDSVQ